MSARTSSLPWTGSESAEPRETNQGNPKATHPWSWRLGQIVGIGIYLHTTFVVMLAWIALSHLMHGHGMGAAVGGLVFTACLFGTVVLHELGHALVARRFGIRTREITLLPIGGVARLERMPEDPRQELLVALAGPAVNVALALVLFATLALIAGPLELHHVHVVGGPLLTKLLWINVSLAVFNLVPAFPMDGGRALRAALATRLGHARATEVAARLGRWIAVVFGIVGLLGNPMLVFIAVFVWMGAAQEASVAQLKSALGGVPVSQAMITDFRTLSSTDRLGRAVELILAGFQQDFPVIDGGRLVGLLSRDDILRGISERGGETPVGDVMRPEVQTADAADMLDTALGRAQEHEGRTVVVVRGSEVIGLVTPENVGELLLVQNARRARRGAQEVPSCR